MPESLKEMEEQAEALYKALLRLRNELSGILPLCEEAVRHAAGNTNLACLKRALEGAQTALDEYGKDD